MSMIRERLTQCFCTVFPALKPEAVPEATATSVTGWDSLGMVTLLTVIHQEFGVRLPLDRIERFRSFASICEFLEAKLNQKPG
jgi:acyl carrier protein